MDTVNVNLAHRWYIGYDLYEAVPDHSSLLPRHDRHLKEIKYVNAKYGE